jgi:hypothetical protein
LKFKNDVVAMATLDAKRDTASNVGQLLHVKQVYFNLVARAFCFRGWMVSEKGPGFGWSVFQPDW